MKFRVYHAMKDEIKNCPHWSKFHITYPNFSYSRWRDGTITIKFNKGGPGLTYMLNLTEKYYQCLVVIEITYYDDLDDALHTIEKHHLEWIVNNEQE